MGEVENFGAVLGNTDKQREVKDQCNKFSEKMKQYSIN